MTAFYKQEMDDTAQGFVYDILALFFTPPKSPASMSRITNQDFVVLFI